MKLPGWAKISRAARVLGLYLPIAVALTMLALQLAGIGYADLRAYVMELAPRSVYAIAIIGLVEAFMRIRGYDVANDERCRLRAIVTNPSSHPTDRESAYAILRMENITGIAALIVFACILLVWQG